jgi:hypothetical protein
MGRLTDSLKSASKELDAIEVGIDRMADLGKELAENTINVADAALKTGYQYGWSEREVGSKLDSQVNESTSHSTSPTALTEVSELRQNLSNIRQSQNSLKTWNDLYRVQQTLVIEYLKQQNLDQSVIEDIQTIFKLRTVSKAPELANRLLDLEQSEILKLIKKVIKYSSHLLTK